MVTGWSGAGGLSVGKTGIGVGMSLQSWVFGKSPIQVALQVTRVLGQKGRDKIPIELCNLPWVLHHRCHVNKVVGNL